MTTIIIRKMNMNINYLTKLTYHNNQIYKIEFRHTAYPLIRSLIKTHLITGGTTNEEYTILTFKAKSVKRLTDTKLSIPEVEQLAKNLTIQLEYMITNETCVPLGLNPRDVIIINETIPVYVGNEFTIEIEDDSQHVNICSPFSTDDFFLAPELTKITDLPYRVHFKAVYFSMAILIIYELLGKRYDFYEDYLRTDTQKIMELLNKHPIYQTKIYWFLSRCLIEDPKRRSLLYI